MWTIGIEMIEEEERSGDAATVPAGIVHVREAEDRRLGL
jgi:hypothetical protein